MITLYSGTPGAGKSLHVARKIYERLLTTKRPVIATFPINMDVVTKKGKKKAAEFIYCAVEDMTHEYLINYALENHKLGKENQTLVVIDECQIIFNPREFSRADRLKWIVFFTQHRKLGFDFILISQFDRLVDRQIRCLFEYNIIHRKANNFGFWAFFLPFKLFVAVSVWYGTKEKCGSEFFIYRKRYGKMYDSFMMFDEEFKGFIKKNGDKVSEFNRKILGLDKPDKLEKSDEQNSMKSENNFNEPVAIEEEIKHFANVFACLPPDEGSRDVINKEVFGALEKIHADENVFEREAPQVEAGDRGSLPKRAEHPRSETYLTRIWNFLNTPVTLFSKTASPAEEPEKSEK